MGSYTFIDTKIKAGVWQGDLIGAGDIAPNLQAMHLGTPLTDMSVAFDDTHKIWRVQVPIPNALINDGVQTFTITDATGATVANFSLIAGEPLADDLRAEITLLRGELEVLKKSFRQHCCEN